MEFLARINWETVLVIAIPGLIGLLGVLWNDFRKKKNASIDTAEAKSLRREPTWVELEESNRKLRAEMDEQKNNFETAMEELETRFKTRLENLERKTNVRIAALSNLLYTAADAWPTGHPAPNFEQSDLDALENTDVPFIWRMGRR